MFALNLWFLGRLITECVKSMLTFWLFLLLFFIFGVNIHVVNFNRLWRKTCISLPENWYGQCASGIVLCSRGKIPQRPITCHMRIPFVLLQGWWWSLFPHHFFSLKFSLVYVFTLLTGGKNKLLNKSFLFWIFTFLPVLNAFNFYFSRTVLISCPMF